MTTIIIEALTGHLLPNHACSLTGVPTGILKNALSEHSLESKATETLLEQGLCLAVCGIAISNDMHCGIFHHYHFAKLHTRTTHTHNSH